MLLQLVFNKELTRHTVNLFNTWQLTVVTFGQNDDQVAHQSVCPLVTCLFNLRMLVHHVRARCYVQQKTMRMGSDVCRHRSIYRWWTSDRRTRKSLSSQHPGSLEGSNIRFKNLHRSGQCSVRFERTERWSVINFGLFKRRMFARQQLLKCLDRCGCWCSSFPQEKTCQLPVMSLRLITCTLIPVKWSFVKPLLQSTRSMSLICKLPWQDQLPLAQILSLLLL